MNFLSSTALLLLTAAAAPAAVNFRTEIWPVLAKNCVDCHRAPHKDNAGKLIEPKGKLRLDGAGGIMKGGNDGDAVVAGDPDKSSIYQRILLPLDHEDAMPPKGKGKPLSFNESELIKQWIIDGADFGGWKGTDSGAPVAAKAAPKSVDPLASGATVAPEAAKAKIASLGALVTPIVKDSPLLRIEWISGAGAVGDKEVAELAAISGNIAELDLSETKITDEALTTVARFPRLTWLKLNDTAVSDAGIAKLKGLANLNYLNLHSTNVSDTALTSLTGLRKLRQVFLWKTRVTPGEAAKFAKSIPDLRVQLE
ncbi:MAG: c-type cytochrome domain-containing protein [Verrucomicrobiota bacterium]